MKILILGGYGVFGGRLAQLLSDVADVHLLIAGRSLHKAEQFCASYTGQPKTTPIELPRAKITDYLANNSVDLIVDASGPFQNYGDQPYSVVTAAIAHKTPYLDFADASDFVAGISQLDKNAKTNGVFVLSGVSSFPVLTAAVARELGKDMSVQSITGGIAPSPYAGIGLNVMRAVVGYAGGSITLLRNGTPTITYRLTESMRYTIAPPGELPLKNTHISLVDVPDLKVIPPLHPELQNIWMGAGPVPEILHRALNVLARLRAKRLLPEFTALSSVFYRILNLAKYGEHRGGMFVQVSGSTSEGSKTRSWHLLAEGDDGPLIPSMAIEAIIRKMLNGDPPEPGARDATNELSLDDYDTLFSHRTFTTGIRTAPDTAQPLYHQLLGPVFDRLPSPIRQLHTLSQPTRWSGYASVSRGTNPLAKLAAFMFRFPPENANTPVSVTFTPTPKGELWQRNFDGHKFSSFQALGAKRNTHLLTERFGPITVALAIVLKENTLGLIPRRWSCFGIPMPTFLLPSGDNF